ncbi:hypothetical protein GOV03_01470 [Candidatus Woesearchaeota archaeon]|nr:hypothetical protein [Candidatus Woesearchaeota archaeon]
MLEVKVDISENARFMDKLSIIGVATEDGTYKKNRALHPKVKKRITNYSNFIEKIHAILIYKLIKNDLEKYSSLQICCDVAKNKLRNNLRKLFSNNVEWHRLDQEKKIKISAVGNSFVDKYVRDVRKGIIRRGKKLSLKIMNEELRKF